MFINVQLRAAVMPRDFSGSFWGRVKIPFDTVIIHDSLEAADIFK